MAGKKISELTNASTPLTGTEQVPLNQSGVTLRATTQDIADLAASPSKVFTTITNNYTVLQTDDVVLVDSTTNSITITLQLAATRGQKPLVIKNIAGNTDNNPVTVQRSGADTIETDTEVIVQGIDLFSLDLQSDGVNAYYII